MADALQRLAAAAGIELRYWDIQGNLHECSPESVRAVLEAMGFAANGEEEAKDSLNMLNEQDWHEVLPAVLVAREDEAIELPVKLSEGDSQRRVPWSILCEDGQQTSGEWLPADSVVAATGEAHGGRRQLRRLRLPSQLLGYHRLRLNGIGETTLIIAPRRCYLPPEWKSRKYWGIAAQLYGVRSARNWGMGDFGDLAQLAAWPIDTIGINPLHALFLDAPDSASPYAPSSRLFVNPLYLDVAAVSASLDLPMDEGGIASDIRNLVERARDSDIVNYPAVAAAKLAVLDGLFREFRSGAFPREDFHAFMASGGADLSRFTAFQALSEHFSGHDWAHWPQIFRDPNSRAVQPLSHELEGRRIFFAFLQWQCDLQLGEAARKCRDRGMKLGIYKDLAVSSDARSADHWANPGIYMHGARVGAPPDPFNERGQEWGIVPLNPHRLRSQAYAHFIALLRANMRHAGALRIDHVMGLMRLFVIPAGAPPSQGVYVRFPLDDLLGIVALESAKHGCLVIGEDLGTVPGGFRERMADANVLSTRILYFERDHGGFRSPGEFPRLAAVSAATHDLATLRGYWTEADIRAKAALGIFVSPEEERRARDERTSDKSLLLQALAREALLPHAISLDAANVSWSPELAAAVQAYLARCQSGLLLVQLDDLAGEELQANLPGTTSGYPSWRRRLHRSIEELADDVQNRHVMATISSERTGTHSVA